MTYNAFLDALFYNYWVGFGVLGAYVLVVWLIRKRYWPHSEKMWPGVILYFLIPFLWIMVMGEVNPFAWGYGKPTEITDVMMMKGDLYVKDFVMSSGSKGTKGSPSYRIHIIDPKTGSKKLRFIPGGSGTLMAVRGDSLIFGYSNAVIFYSKTNGKYLLEWTAKTLPAVYPQLKAGISDFWVDKDKRQISITALDGNKWVLHIFSRRLMKYEEDERERERSVEDDISLTKNGISTGTREHFQRLVRLCEKPGGEKQMVLCGHRDSALNNEIFLDGKIVALSVKDSCFVIRHYETIKRQKVLFSCVTLDGKKKLWTYRQGDAPWSLMPDESPAVSSCIDVEDGIFIASIKDKLIAMQLKDGRELWSEVP